MADIPRSIQQAPESRYKDTVLRYVEALDSFTYDLWEPPQEFDLNEVTVLKHRVVATDIGCLDLLALDYYGDESLWWIIAQANNIIDPVDEMTVGQVLNIPQREVVDAFISRQTRLVESVDD